MHRYNIDIMHIEAFAVVCSERNKKFNRILIFSGGGGDSDVRVEGF